MASRIRIHSPVGKSHVPIVHSSLVAKKQKQQPTNAPKLDCPDPKFNFDLSKIPVSSPHKSSQPSPKINPKLGDNKLGDKKRENESKNSETTIQTFTPSSPEQPQEVDKTKNQLQQPELRVKSEPQPKKADVFAEIKRLSRYNFDLTKIPISAPNRPPVQTKQNFDIPSPDRVQQPINGKRERSLAEESNNSAIASPSIPIVKPKQFDNPDFCEKEKEIQKNKEEKSLTKVLIQPKLTIDYYGSQQGQDLLEHELTHVVQQSDNKIQRHIIQRQKKSYEKIPQWEELPRAAWDDLKRLQARVEGDQKAFNFIKAYQNDPLKRLTLLNLYVKLKDLNLWKFVDRIEKSTSIGDLEFLAINVKDLIKELKRRKEFKFKGTKRLKYISIEGKEVAVVEENWECRELRGKASIHFKHFDGWPENKVQAHIDQAGWILGSYMKHIRDWYFEKMLPEFIVGRKNVFEIRKLLLEQKKLEKKNWSSGILISKSSSEPSQEEEEVNLAQIKSELPNPKLCNNQFLNQEERPRKYSLESGKGKRLMPPELTQVVQQKRQQNHRADLLHKELGDNFQESSNKQKEIQTLSKSSSISSTRLIQCKPKKYKADRKSSTAFCKKQIRRVRNIRQYIKILRKAEQKLIKCGFKDPSIRIKIFSEIYYGTAWSRDYQVEKSKVRNLGFQIYTRQPYSLPLEGPDPRNCLECGLFFALRNSGDVGGMDMGHLFIGLNARTSSVAREGTIFPGLITSGLENVTWIGDLGGAAARVAIKRLSNPKAGISRYFRGKDYGAPSNLEGDIAAYVVASGSKMETKPTDIRLPSSGLISDALEIYLLARDAKKKNPYKQFLIMQGGLFDNRILLNRLQIEKIMAEKIAIFGLQYMINFLRQHKKLDFDLVNKARSHLPKASFDISHRFVSWLLKRGWLN